jgi:hypothetical protein
MSMQAVWLSFEGRDQETTARAAQLRLDMSKVYFFNGVPEEGELCCDSIHCKLLQTVPGCMQAIVLLLDQMTPSCSAGSSNPHTIKPSLSVPAALNTVHSLTGSSLVLLFVAGRTDGLFQDLERLAVEHSKCQIIFVVDTFGPALAGNENDGDVVTRFMSKMQNFNLRNRNSTWLLMDHSRKNNRTEGALLQPFGTQPACLDA